MPNLEDLSIHIESAGERWQHARVRRFSGREAISQLFSYDLEVVCDADHDLHAEAYPGAEISVVLEQNGVDVRRIHGQLGPVRDRLEPTGAYRTYLLRLHPRALRLTLVETQEVYLGLAVPDILMKKLAMHGFGAGDVELRLRATYAPREIVVQYGESDLAFVSRLTEHLGISFFFEHDSGKDKLVFADDPSGFRPVEGAEEVTFHAHGEAAGVFALEVTTDAVPGTYFVQDYNYRTPSLDPTGQYTLESGGEGGVVEYGAHVKTPDEAAWLARVRGEERVAQARVYDGKGAFPALEAGRRATLVDHPRLATHEDLLVLEVEHEATVPTFQEAGAAPPAYRNAFRAIPAAVPYRPPRRTPRPRMVGVVTGVVQPGPGGEVGGVAMLDQHGRYTVQLHFDTAQPGEQKASHPVRMAQPFAGQGNGMHFPLLPGTEVLIAFANGDPDRPVIVGAVPNTTSPSVITASEADTHRIRSARGVVIQFGAVKGRP